jgi:hypothetical protein
MPLRKKKPPVMRKGADRTFITYILICKVREEKKKEEEREKRRKERKESRKE